MKQLFLSFLILSMISCSAQKKEVPATIDEEGNLIGIAHKKDFLQEPYLSWFSSNYEEYKTDIDIINDLKPLLKNVNVKVFMGTWCGDSQQQTPVFYKILDQADFDYKNLELITVNREKITPDNLQEGFSIEYVPTFIFYKNGEEIGRFVEYPRETVEVDVLKIVGGKPYKHSYED